jgi:hypothetical protein
MSCKETCCFADGVEPRLTSKHSSASSAAAGPCCGRSGHVHRAVTTSALTCCTYRFHAQSGSGAGDVGQQLSQHRAGPCVMLPRHGHRWHLVYGFSQQRQTGIKRHSLLQASRWLAESGDTVTLCQRKHSLATAAVHCTANRVP